MRCDVTVSHTFAISQPCCIAEWHWPQPWIDCGVRTGRRYGVPAPWPMHCCECVVTLSGLVPAVVHMISDRVGCGVLRVPVGSLRVTKRSTVTCLRIYGFTPLPPPLAGRPADAHLLIKSSPVCFCSEDKCNNALLHRAGGVINPVGPEAHPCAGAPPPSTEPC